MLPFECVGADPGERVAAAVSRHAGLSTQKPGRLRALAVTTTR